MKILGIDPGSTRAGFGLIESVGSSIKLLDCGLLKVATKEAHTRLEELATEYSLLLEKEKPDLVALEKLFFMKNIKTGMEVAQARGVLMLITAQHKVPFIEIAPTEVKKYIAGSGNADKKMVEKMVCRMCGIDKIEGPDDISDAVAIAVVAGHYQKVNKLRSA